MSEQITTDSINPTGIASAAYQFFVQLPYSALTISRQAESLRQGDEKMPGTIMVNGDGDPQPSGPVSDELFQLLTSPQSVSSLLAEDPSISPHQAWKTLYGDYNGKVGASQSGVEAGHSLATDEALERAAQSGHWGPTQPSELFLRVSLDGRTLLITVLIPDRYITMPSSHWRKTQPALWSAHPLWEAVACCP